jgi:hypothetical protein
MGNHFLIASTQILAMRVTWNMLSHRARDISVRLDQIKRDSEDVASQHPYPAVSPVATVDKTIC